MSLLLKIRCHCDFVSLKNRGFVLCNRSWLVIWRLCDFVCSKTSGLFIVAAQIDDKSSLWFSLSKNTWFIQCSHTWLVIRCICDLSLWKHLVVQSSPHIIGYKVSLWFPFFKNIWFVHWLLPHVIGDKLSLLFRLFKNTRFVYCSLHTMFSHGSIAKRRSHLGWLSWHTVVVGSVGWKAGLKT